MLSTAQISYLDATVDCTHVGSVTVFFCLFVTEMGKCGKNHQHNKHLYEPGHF